MEWNLYAIPVVPIFDMNDYEYHGCMHGSQGMEEFVELVKYLYKKDMYSYTNVQTIDSESGDIYTAPYKYTRHTHQEFTVKSTPTQIQVFMHKNGGDPAIVCFYADETHDQPFILMDSMGFLDQFIGYLNHKKQNPNLPGNWLKK